MRVESDNILEVTRAAGWARIRVNRPGVRNAADTRTWEALLQAITTLGTAPDVKTLIITGRGDQAFMAGADLREFPEILKSCESTLRYLKAIEAVLGAVESLDKPVIAEINGAAMGGGLELAVVCDYRLAVSSARVGIPSANLGVGLAFKDVERLVALAGLATARELLMFSRIFSAAEAQQKGLIDEIVPHDRLAARAEELAGEWAEKAPLSLKSAKYSFTALMHGGDDSLKWRALQAIEEAWGSDELKNRVTRFLGRG